MEAWLVLLGSASLIGGLSAWYLRGVASWLVACLATPALFLAWLLAGEYLLPYRGGGASMWPIAFVIGGTAAAFAGCVALLLVRRARAWRDRSPRRVRT